ncbi:MAG: hypothetical protein RIS64_1936 [Bacteroidota bacterium]|jgi:putative CRISPR-associated protein (TIGR02619 family)
MKLITTVGTSIFSNSDVPYNDYKISFTESDWNEIKKEPIIETVTGWALREGANASAEIASIVKIQKDLKQPIEIHLICTETIPSRLAAECIQGFFEKDDTIKIVSIQVIKDLQVTDKKTFERGLANLFQTITTIAKGDWKGIAFNITGGYKAVIPHLTVLGQIYRCSIYYVFDEGGDNPSYELLKMPVLPIHFDWVEVEPLIDYLKDGFKKDENIKKLLFLFEKKYIKEKQNSYEINKTKEGNSQKEIEINTGELSVYNTIYQRLLINNLITNELDITPLGNWIQQNKDARPAGKTFLGDTMELFVESYFNQPKKHPLIKDYMTQKKYDVKGKFKIDLQSKSITLGSGAIQIGDIDIFLKNTITQNDVLCELKSLSTLSDYKKEINTKDDYFFQLKARSLKYLQDHPTVSKVEILLLIYEFQIKNAGKKIQEKIEMYDNTKNVLEHLKTIEQDNDLKEKVIFNIYGLQKIQSFDQYGAKRSLYEMKDDANIFSKITI